MTTQQFLKAVEGEFDIETLELMKGIIDKRVNFLNQLLNVANPRTVVQGFKKHLNEKKKVAADMTAFMRELIVNEDPKGWSPFLVSPDNPKGETDGLDSSTLSKILMKIAQSDDNQLAEWYQAEYKIREVLRETVREILDEEKPGLWANIRAKRARGEKPAHKNSNAHKDAVKAGKKINAMKEDLSLDKKKDLIRKIAKLVKSSGGHMSMEDLVDLIARKITVDTEKKPAPGTFKVIGGTRFVENVDFTALEKVLDDMFEDLDIDINFTTHFKERVIERGLTEEDIIELMSKIHDQYGDEVADLYRDENRVFTHLKRLVDIAAVNTGYGDDYLKDLVLKTAFKRNSPTEPEFRTNASAPKLKVAEGDSIHEPVRPGILKNQIKGKVTCSKASALKAKQKDKSNNTAKAAQRFLNYHCK